MAHYDSEKNEIVRWPSKRSECWPNWIEEDCGCCAGIEWGGEYPRECRDCGGMGVVYVHSKSGARAMYPGGPFCGREPKETQKLT